MSTKTYQDKAKRFTIAVRLSKKWYLETVKRAGPNGSDVPLGEYARNALIEKLKSERKEDL